MLTCFEVLKKWVLKGPLSVYRLVGRRRAVVIAVAGPATLPRIRCQRVRGLRADLLSHCKLPSPYRTKTNWSRVSFHTFVVVHRYSENCSFKPNSQSSCFSLFASARPGNFHNYGSHLVSGPKFPYPERRDLVQSSNCTPTLSASAEAYLALCLPKYCWYLQGVGGGG